MGIKKLNIWSIEQRDDDKMTLMYNRKYRGGRKYENTESNGCILR